MRYKSIPRQHPNSDHLGDCLSWFEEMAQEQAERERVEERRRLQSNLEATARLLTVQDPAHVLVHAVMPDSNDPLEEMDPRLEDELDFPVSSEEFWATWRIGVVREIPEDDDGVHHIQENGE